MEAILPETGGIFIHPYVDKIPKSARYGSSLLQMKLLAMQAAGWTEAVGESLT
jgi:hypothetical protein